MLTVKHIDDFGFERVLPANEVRTRGREYPALLQKTQYIQPLDTRPNFIVDCVRGTAGVETIRDGQIYVMNENGKTVASYDLRHVVGVKANCDSAEDAPYALAASKVRGGAILGDANAKLQDGIPL